jgi:hypothetical protein
MRKQQVLAGAAALALTWCAAARADENVKIIQGPPSSVLSTPAEPATGQQQACCRDGQYLRQGSIVVEPTIVYPARAGDDWHDGDNHGRHNHDHDYNRGHDRNRPHPHKSPGPG